MGSLFSSTVYDRMGILRKKSNIRKNSIENIFIRILTRSWTKFVQRHPRQNGTRFIGQAIQRLSASVELGTKIARQFC
ncbi:DNA-directed RNA polymerase subunit alpha [Trichinella spiralis]|uniref:DNA-directed RNA polymerase subunit alpha n=1 Tax=Trichinella spiralis TaxID=6334 RepID=A0ABR3KDT7_TRISP